jgi:hypothetical protein
VPFALHLHSVNTKFQWSPPSFISAKPTDTEKNLTYDLPSLTKSCDSHEETPNSLSLSTLSSKIELLNPAHPPHHNPNPNSHSVGFGFGPNGMLSSQLPDIAEASSSERVYVALGNSIEKAVSLLNWVFESLGARQICLLHVHRPSPLIPTLCKLYLSCFLFFFLFLVYVLYSNLEMFAEFNLFLVLFSNLVVYSLVGLFLESFLDPRWDFSSFFNLLLIFC